MAELQYTTSGNMTIKLEGLQFGRHIADPFKNVKSFSVGPSQITLHAENQNHYTDMGRIEILDLNPNQNGLIIVTIDSPTWAFYGTAQFFLFAKGQCILSDNFQSGVKGPVGDPKVIKRYPIGFIG